MRRLRPPTPGTRMMLWVYPTITLLYGLIYRFQSPLRMESGAFDKAKDIAPMHTWGIIFLAVGLVKIVCILAAPRDPELARRRDSVYIVMMCLGGALYSTWGFLFLLSSLESPTASYASCLLPFGWAIAHLAMLATIVRGR